MKNENRRECGGGDGDEVMKIKFLVFSDKAKRKVVAPPLNLSHSLLLPYYYSLASTNVAVVAWLCIRTTMKPLSTVKVVVID